jgi:hypothetical protein
MEQDETLVLRPVGSCTTDFQLEKSRLAESKAVMEGPLLELFHCLP